jgi:hypothetical protein
VTATALADALGEGLAEGAELGVAVAPLEVDPHPVTRVRPTITHAPTAKFRISLTLLLVAVDRRR